MAHKRKIEYVAERFSIGYLGDWDDPEEFSRKLQDAIEKAKQFTNGLKKVRIFLEHDFNWSYGHTVDGVELYVVASGRKSND